MNQESTVTDISTRAKEKAAAVPEHEVQRELLAQLYIQNHLLTYQYKAVEKIKGHLTFYTILYIASFLLAIVMFVK